MSEEQKEKKLEHEETLKVLKALNEQEEKKKKIIKVLDSITIESKTISQISKDTGESKEYVRTCLNRLSKKGLVKIVDKVNDKINIWGLQDPKLTVNDILKFLKWYNDLFTENMNILITKPENIEKITKFKDNLKIISELVKNVK